MTSTRASERSAEGKGACRFLCRKPGRWALLLFGALVIHLTSGAAEEKKPEVLCVVGGDLYTITDGILKGGTILCRDGKIEEIGRGVTVPKDAKVIDAKGKAVMPGMVAARASVGVFSGSDKIAEALDPMSLGLELAAASGITAGYVVSGGPSGDNPLGGTNAALKFTFGALDSMVLREPASLNVRFGPSAPVQSFAFREGLRQAREYLRKQGQHQADQKAGKKVPAPAKPNGADDYIALLTRRLPARLQPRDQNDILAALRLVDDYEIRLILDGGTEAWPLATQIAKRNASVILCPRDKQVANEFVSRPTGSSPQTAALLARAGIPLALAPPSPVFSADWIGSDLQTLTFSAAFAVQGGLPEDAALEAITLGPARILGVADRIGSLQVGKDADFLVLDGSPLDIHTFVETTVINGKVCYEKNKSTFFARVKRRQEGAKEEAATAPGK